jgi:hypothetical protein
VSRRVGAAPAATRLKAWGRPIRRIADLRRTTRLRGTIRLHLSDYEVPIRSNAQLEALVRTWLFSGGNTTGS